MRFLICLLSVSFLTWGTAFAQSESSAKKAIGSPKEQANLEKMPFSPAILKGDTLYVSGQVGFVNGKRPDDFEEEVKAALESVGKTLHQAGYDFADVVAANVYLTDIGQIDEMNKVYVKYFPVPRPARATVGVQKLVSNARIEIMVTARK
jgi:2-iminobutanoate/2-iminopropanoate deaminase